MTVFTPNTDTRYYIEYQAADGADWQLVTPEDFIGVDGVYAAARLVDLLDDLKALVRTLEPGESFRVGTFTADRPAASAAAVADDLIDQEYDPAATIAAFVRELRGEELAPEVLEQLERDAAEAWLDSYRPCDDDDDADAEVGAVRAYLVEGFDFVAGRWDWTSVTNDSLSEAVFYLYEDAANAIGRMIEYGDAWAAGRYRIALVESVGANVWDGFRVVETYDLD